MYTIIIFAIIGIIFAIMLNYGDRCPLSQWFGTSFFLACIGAFIGALVAIALPTKTEIILTSYQLVTLQDNSSINGNFFLGCGRVNGSMKYIFYYEKKDMFQMGQLDSYDIPIKYSDNPPKLEIYSETEVKGAWINYFAIDKEDSYSKSYIICVPKGTIKQEFNLNAQ